MTIRTSVQGVPAPDTEVLFTLEPESRRDRKLAVPVGRVNGMEVPGLGKSKSGWLGFGTRRFVARLPLDKAANMLEFHQLYAAGRAGKYNCLAYMAASQGWPIDVAELFLDTGPDLVPGTFQEVTDLTSLAPGEPYGLPDDDDQLIHGVVGVGVFDRHIEVDADGGHVRIAQTTRTVPAYLGNCVLPNRLVHLVPGSYVSSELAESPSRMFVPLAAA